MKAPLAEAFSTGYERMAAWSELLDTINVFPVADADTGRNLRASLAPLTTIGAKPDLDRRLLISATGNAGNIAAAFFSRFTAVDDPGRLGLPAAEGARAAWDALAAPQQGTMLSVFDALSDALDKRSQPMGPEAATEVIAHLKETVIRTRDQLSALTTAGVVDAGALGMYLFFEGFLICLVGGKLTFPTPMALFNGLLDVVASGDRGRSNAYCVDAAIRLNDGVDNAAGIVAGLGNSVVTQSDDRLLKVHLHVDRIDDTRRHLAELGTLLRWQPEEIHLPPSPLPPPISSPGVHVVTDAAGSLSPDTARRMGISLLDSYLVFDDRVIPESLVQPDALYDAMAQGEKVSTAQASTFERHQHYERLVDRYERVVYLAVGSAFTGNCQIARKWVRDHRCRARMAVIDTAAASGKLGLLAIDVSRFAAEGHGLEAVAAFAAARAEQCDELVFLDQLKFLAAGGRISKVRGMVGDFIRYKPVIRPTARGAEKAGAVKSRSAQVRFALDTMAAAFPETGPVHILLAYTDNRDWVETVAKPAIEARLGATVGWIEPMSSTSGAHMGPGTWAVAYLPARPSPGDHPP